jgi:hypothetical protein
LRRHPGRPSPCSRRTQAPRPRRRSSSGQDRWCGRTHWPKPGPVRIRKLSSRRSRSSASHLCGDGRCVGHLHGLRGGNAVDVDVDVAQAHVLLGNVVNCSSVEGVLEVIPVVGRGMQVAPPAARPRGHDRGTPSPCPHCRPATRPGSAHQNAPDRAPHRQALPGFRIDPGPSRRPERRLPRNARGEQWRCVFRVGRATLPNQIPRCLRTSLRHEPAPSLGSRCPSTAPRGHSAVCSCNTRSRLGLDTVPPRYTYTG